MAPLAELHELRWKYRFVARLAALFAQSGLDAASAIADAHAHADDCYPRRKDGEPEEEATALYLELKSDSP
jgi:hypothetical protein